MKDSEFPSFVDEEEDAQATMMWDRDEVDLSDLDLDVEPDASRIKPRETAAAGLNEGDLFGDLADLASEQRAASIPVDGRLVQTKRPPANDAPAQPAKPVASAPEKLARPLPHWGWAAAIAALVMVASLVYVLID